MNNDIKIENGIIYQPVGMDAKDYVAQLNTKLNYHRAQIALLESTISTVTTAIPDSAVSQVTPN